MAKMKAYAVTEEDENTGGIIYAEHNIVARRLGANEYADGEIAYVSCRRAPWADEYYGIGLPISVMVDNGWHFECHGCGQRIDSDMLYDQDRRSEDIVGTQDSLVFCDAVCEAYHNLNRAKCKKLETRWVRRFIKIVKRYFPDAEPEYRHAYASRNNDGRYTISHVSVQFDFPGREYAMAELAWRKKSSWEKEYPKPHFTCSSDDKEAFKLWAADQKLKREAVRA